VTVPDAQSSGGVSFRLKIAGTVFRTLFMGLLLAIVVRVAWPQSETIWSAWETPGDLVRLVLGLAAGGWILVHLFIPPRDAAAYRTWVYLGLGLVPIAIIWVLLRW